MWNMERFLQLQARNWFKLGHCTEGKDVFSLWSEHALGITFKACATALGFQDVLSISLVTDRIELCIRHLRFINCSLLYCLLGRTVCALQAFAASVEVLHFLFDLWNLKMLEFGIQRPLLCPCADKRCLIGLTVGAGKNAGRCGCVCAARDIDCAW